MSHYHPFSATDNRKDTNFVTSISLFHQKQQTKKTNNMISVTITGRLGHDVERKDKDSKAPEKGKFVPMSISSEYFSHGENKTMWVDVAFRNDLISDRMLESLKKGKMVQVMGEEVAPRTWIGKDGEAHAKIVVYGKDLRFVRVKKGESSTENNTDSQQTKQQQQPQQQEEGQMAFTENNDDLPF